MEFLHKIDPQTIAILLVALAIVWAAWQLRAALRLISGERMRAADHLSRVADANVGLLSSQKGRRSIVDFMLSEAALSSFIGEIESRVSDQTVLDIDILVEQMPQDDDKAGVVKRGWEWLKKNRGKIGEKLFDKINGVIKRVIPGLGDDDD